MIDGEITDNTANYGGVFVASNGTFTMSGGKISDNTTTSGGGVYIAGNFTLLDGVISDNTAANNGGGVFMETNGTFTIINGIIKGNTATNIGGGVFVSGTGTFRIVTGTIYGLNEAVESFRNTSTFGAALYKESSGTSAECGTFIGEEWNKAENGDLDTTNNTIKVIGGMLQ
jgi:predicted outer membrane repeat protein